EAVDNVLHERRAVPTAQRYELPFPMLVAGRRNDPTDLHIAETPCGVAERRRTHGVARAHIGQLQPWVRAEGDAHLGTERDPRVQHVDLDRPVTQFVVGLAHDARAGGWND